MKIFWLSLCLVLWTGETRGQQVDSLKNELALLKERPVSYVRDTTLVNTLNSYAKALINDDPFEGIKVSQDALKLAERIGWVKGILKSYQSLASIQNISNRHYEAVQTALRGLQLAQKSKNAYFEVVFLRSLANNYDMLDNYQKAIPYYQECLKKSAKVPNTDFIRANVLIELGDAYRFHLHKPALAKQLIVEAVEICKKKLPSALGYAYDYLGEALTDLKEYEAAEKTFKLSRIELEKSKKYYLIPELLFHTAQLYLNQGKYTEAKAFAAEGVRLSQKQATIYGESEANKILYLTHKATNQPTEALAYYERYTILRDSLTEVNINHRFEQAQSEYKDYKHKLEIEKLQAAQRKEELQKQQLVNYFLIGLLVLASIVGVLIFRSNRTLRKKNAEISEALLKGQAIERKRVAADLHDSLGSTMSSLIWTLDSINTQKLPQQELEIYATLKKMLTNAYNEVRLLSHNLLPEELEKQGLSAALKYFIRKINQNSSIRFNLHIDETLDKLDKKVEFELYSICLELVNNIIKHSKATEAKLRLHSATNGKIQLIIEDNGIGIFENNSDGKGMKNVRARVESLNGTWNLVSTENMGTNSQITIPI
ncbi:histidine kinase [Emticicia sp. W12TSBA100-4]|uniref:tetratricopeptide repeat-containing sensor histidine kinase n=1 Tax=Emticicia sp. W12TSBA100-4 TaxID=3160965 RepID=UPI00330610E5